MNLRKAVVSIIIFSVLAAVPVLALAAGLVPCGGPGESACSLCHLFELAQGITKFLTFTIAPILAVLAVAWGGFNIFLAGADPGRVKVGRDAITRAAIGILIVFGAWVAINEVLIFFSQQTSSVAEIKTAAGKWNPWTNITCSTKILPTVTAPPTTSTATTGTWGDDSAIRKDLEYYDIRVNKDNCANIGQQNCTSLYGLGAKAIAGLKNLEAYCNWKCQITITGGTEYWLHGNKNTDINANTTTWHKPGQNVVDLSSNNALVNQVIKGEYTGTYLGDNPARDYKVSKVDLAARETLTTGVCSRLGQDGYKFYVPAGKTFCIEMGDCITTTEEKIIALYIRENINVPDHWHICYY